MSTTLPTPPPRADLNDSVYTALREGLARAGYFKEAIAEYLQLGSLSQFFDGRAPDTFTTDVTSPLSALCQSFLIGRAMEPALLRANLGDAFVDAGLEAGLLLPVNVDGTDALAAAASVYPVEDFWMASERVSFFPGSGQTKPYRDVVYPAATRGVEVFLRFLPRRPCNRFLEACGGCGPAAVVASVFAKQTVSSDLEPRSAAFAAFNGRLRGLSNFSSVAGPYYEGTEGQFDCIAAHPPYMPNLGEFQTYYGGGPDGTEVLRGLVAGLEERLAPGGLFYAETIIPRLGGKPYAEVLRDWIGAAADQFDVGVFVLTPYTNSTLAMNATVKGGRGIAYQSRLLECWQQEGITEFALCVAYIWRHEEPGVPIDCHRVITESTKWEDLLAVLEWERKRNEPAVLQQLMESPVVASPSLRIHSVHEARNGELVNLSVKAVVNEPLHAEGPIDQWMAFLFARADGSRTGQELMAGLIEDGVVPPDTPPEQFAHLLAGLVGVGFLLQPTCLAP
jgi:hypothetical protein